MFLALTLSISCSCSLVFCCCCCCTFSFWFRLFSFTVSYMLPPLNRNGSKWNENSVNVNAIIRININLSVLSSPEYDHKVQAGCSKWGTKCRFMHVRTLLLLVQYNLLAGSTYSSSDSLIKFSFGNGYAVLSKINRHGCQYFSECVRILVQRNGIERIQFRRNYQFTIRNNDYQFFGISQIHWHIHCTYSFCRIWAKYYCIVYSWKKKKYTKRTIHTIYPLD